MPTSGAGQADPEFIEDFKYQDESSESRNGPRGNPSRRHTKPNLAAVAASDCCSETDPDYH